MADIGDAALHPRWSGVGIRGQEAEHGDGQPSQDEQKQGNDDAEDEIAHFASRDSTDFRRTATDCPAVQSDAGWPEHPALLIRAPAT